MNVHHTYVTWTWHVSREKMWGESKKGWGELESKRKQKIFLKYLFHAESISNYRYVYICIKSWHQCREKAMCGKEASQ